MKNVLLAVSGLSPQVITETLYALHQQQKRIDAVHIITTRPGNLYGSNDLEDIKKRGNHGMV